VDRAGRRTSPKGIRTYFQGFGWRSGDVSTAVLDVAGFLDGPLALPLPLLPPVFAPLLAAF
jgi:hypothetical protein